MVSIHYLQEVLYGIFKKPIIGPVKFKMAEIRHLETEIRHLENRHDAFFLLWSVLCGRNLAD